MQRQKSILEFYDNFIETVGAEKRGVDGLFTIHDLRIDPATIHFPEKPLRDEWGIPMLDKNGNKTFLPVTWQYCKMPYPGHKNGCPNYGKNPLCPPSAKFRKDIVQKYKNATLVYLIFDFKAYKERMVKNFPGWTERQVKCVLYWQSSLKSKILAYIIRNYGGIMKEVLGCGSGFMNSQSMEASGINVFSTLRTNGIVYFEEKPVNKVYLVSLVLW